MTLALKVNGRELAAPEALRNVRLLDFIRDHAGLTGTKFGCGVGLCGACTLHLDGVAQRACQLTVEEAVGAEIVTIEGLAGADDLEGQHPVQRAWIAEAVPQCGYCQPGQIMTAAAFLKVNPQPSDREIRAAMDGNLCRCGTYQRIRRAVARAAREARHA